MDLRIMAQRLEVSDTLCNPCYGLLIYDISRIKSYLHMKTVPDHALQYLNLHCSHQLDINLS